MTMMRGKRASDNDDEERATATTSKYWGFFGLVLVQRLCIRFLFIYLFIFYFYKHSIGLGLFCFCFV